MNMNKEIASRIIILFESCNQLKLLAEEIPDTQYLKNFAEQLYHGLNDLFLFQELQKFESSLGELLAKVIAFQNNNTAVISSSTNEQMETMKNNLVEIQNLIGNE